MPPTFLGGHLTNHQRTTFDLLANQIQLLLTFLLGPFARSLHNLTSCAPPIETSISFAGAVTDDRRGVRCVGKKNLTGCGATRSLDGSSRELPSTACALSHPGNQVQWLALGAGFGA